MPTLWTKRKLDFFSILIEQMNPMNVKPFLYNLLTVKGFNG
jgi:hypothetical protein